MDLLRRGRCGLSPCATARLAAAVAVAATLSTGACTRFTVGSSDDPAAGPDAAAGSAGDASDAGSGTSGASHPAAPIPDGDFDGVTSTIDIASPCTVNQVQVNVNIVHPFRGNLLLTLTNPAGTEVILKDYDGSDDGANLIGSYPATLTSYTRLSVFNGMSGQGAWLLQASDLAPDHIGTLDSWGLRLTCAGP